MISQKNLIEPLFDALTYQLWIEKARRDPSYASKNQIDRWEQALDWWRGQSNFRDYHDDWMALLFERRVSQEAIRDFEIQPCQGGWWYPVPNGGKSKRFKSVPGGDAKYRWIPSKPTAAQFYYPSKIEEAIRSSNGVCFYMSGEADVWAMYSAGIKNVISGFSESHVPSTLIDLLRSLGVMKLVIFPDLDQTGMQWSRRVAEKLTGNEIKLEAHQLPDELGAKGDVGKAWKAYKGEPDGFLGWLLSLPIIPIDIVGKTPKKRNHPASSKNYVIPQGYIAKIIELLGVDNFGEDGFSVNNIRCLFHDDHNPSASLNYEKGIFCHACGRWYGWNEIGIKLGIGSISSWCSDECQSSGKTITGLSTEMREHFLKVKLNHTARLLDVLLMSGWEAGKVFTVRDAEQACVQMGVSKRIVRRAISQCVSHRHYCQLFPLSSLQEVKPEDSRKKCGRPEKVYKFVSLIVISQILGFSPVKLQHYDGLQKSALANIKLYRAEVYASLPRRRPGQYTRRLLSERIGVRPRTTRSYDRLAGLKVIPREKRERLTLDLVQNLPEVRRDKNFYQWIEDDSGRKFSATQRGLKMAKGYLGNLWLVTKEANHYEPEDYEE